MHAASNGIRGYVETSCGSPHYASPEVRPAPPAPPPPRGCSAPEAALASAALRLATADDLRHIGLGIFQPYCFNLARRCLKTPGMRVRMRIPGVST